MDINELVKEFAQEIKELNIIIKFEENYNEEEIKIMQLACMSHRNQKNLAQKITNLEKEIKNLLEICRDAMAKATWEIGKNGDKDELNYAIKKIDTFFVS